MSQLGQEEPVGTGRLLLTTAIIGVLFAVWAYWMQPGSGKQQPKQQPAKEATAAPAPPAAITAAPPPAVTATEPVQAASRQTVTLENDDLRLVFDNKGAVLLHAILKHYKERDAKENDDLVSPLSEAMGRYPLRLLTGDETFDAAANGALFHVEQSTREKGASAVTFTWADDKGNRVKKSFSLPPSGYETGFDAELMRNGKVQPETPVEWGPDLGRLSAEQAKDHYFQQACAVMDKEGQYERVLRKKVDGAEEASQQAKGPLVWAGVSTNYFAALFIPDKSIAKAQVLTGAVAADMKKVHPADSYLSLAVDYPGSGKLYLGPKEYSRFKAMGGVYFRLLNWGTSNFGNAILNPVCAALLFVLKWLYGICKNYGLAILLLTALIKLAFYPLTQRSMVKMKEMGEAMRKLKPQVDRIKAKYKKMPKDMATRTKMNEEMMALYQREGINPMAQMTGCLPMLLQMPVFLALFTLLPTAIELRGAPFFFWIKDLSVADPYYVTPILMGATMILSTKMTMTTEMEGMQKALIWVMPLVLVYWCLFAPAGLALYWLANSVLTIGQQYLINRQVAARQDAAQRERKSTPKGPSKPSR